MKVRIIYCFLLIFLTSGLSVNAQTVDDIGKIVIGVKVLPTATKETLTNSTFLQNKLRNIAANAGFSSYGENAFFMTPSISINDVRMVEGGMKNIYVVNGDLFLSVQEGESGTVYASTSFPFRGNGTSKESAIKAGLQNISYGNMKPLFDESRKRILEYYASMQDKIFANADMLAQNKEFDAAIACLLTIPEELFEPYQKAYAKACAIYRQRDAYIAEQEALRVKENNNQVLVKARSLLASHDAKATLEALWDYTITGTEQDAEYDKITKQAEGLITAAEQAAIAKAKQEYEDRKLKEERAYADSRQEYSDNVAYRNRMVDLDEKKIDYAKAAQSEMTDAIKSVALAYIKKGKKLF